MTNDPVKDYQVLKSKPRSNEALELLKRLASQVKPILINHNWTIKNLCEFFPTNSNLLGVNVNKGWKINLRLRPHYDQTQFLEYEDILGTLLHEITHIVRGPHDEQFYKLLEQLKRETEDLMASGYHGEGFYSAGHQLSLGGSVPRYLSNQIAAKAAEKRLQMSKLMLPAGGVRLGGACAGAQNKSLSPAYAAAMAAERRRQDQIWCGGSVQQNITALSSSSQSVKTSPSPQSESSVKREDVSSSSGKRKMHGAGEPVVVAKKSRVTAVIDLTHEEDANDNVAVQQRSREKSYHESFQGEEDQWACPTCTLLNKPLVLVCEVCLNERPFTA